MKTLDQNGKASNGIFPLTKTISDLADSLLANDKFINSFRTNRYSVISGLKGIKRNSRYLRDDFLAFLNARERKRGAMTAQEATVGIRLHTLQISIEELLKEI